MRYEIGPRLVIPSDHGTVTQMSCQALSAFAVYVPGGILTTSFVDGEVKPSQFSDRAGNRHDNPLYSAGQFQDRTLVRPER